MVLDNRLIGIRSNWEPTIRIVKITIRFSTSRYIATVKGLWCMWLHYHGDKAVLQASPIPLNQWYQSQSCIS